MPKPLNKYFYSALLIALPIVTQSVSAEVILNVPSNVDLLVVNGKEPQLNSRLFSSTNSVNLPDGDNQIVFRFEPAFPRGKELDQFSSDVVIAKFNASNQQLEFQFPNYRSLKQAEDFNQNPNWQLLNEQQSRIEITQDKLIKQGMQIGRNFEFETAQYNQTSAPAAITRLTTTPVTAQVTDNQDDTTPYQNTEEQMLHYWFDKADKATRQRFLDSVQTQN